MLQREISLGYRYYVLALLTGVNIFSFMDRMIIAVLLEPIKQELQISDGQVGAMVGMGFAATYVLCGFPMARIADRGVRVKLITVAVTFWSVLTMLSGAVTNAMQMLIARLGVGVGEAGGQPPAQALVAEYFPIERRTVALGVFSTGAFLGSFLGASMAGYLGETYGWRSAFVALGALGLPFALLFGLTVRELPLPQQPAESESRNFFQALAAMLRRPAYRNVMIANGILSFTSWGANTFNPAFFLRTHGLSISEAGNVQALASVLPVASILLVSFATSRLFKRNPMWLIWVPMIAATAAIPFFLGLYLAPVWQLSAASYAVGQVLIGSMFGLFLATMQSLVWSHERALAAALLMFFAVFLGMGLGPVAVGLLSDALRPQLGSDSLKWALVACQLLPVWGVFHLWLASRTYRDELKGDTSLETTREER